MNESLLYQRLKEIRHEEKASSLEETTEKYLELLSIYPNETVIYRKLAILFTKHQLVEQALLAIDSGIELDANYSKNYFVKGRILDEFLNYPESIKSYKKCVELDPSNRQAKFHLSVALLSNGDYENGLPLYQYRLSEEQLSRVSAIPYWSGPACSGKTLIWSEQGVGDEIMFLRLAPMLTKLKGSFVIECDKRFITTLKYNFPELTFLPKSFDIPNAGYDYQCPVGDLLVHFYTELTHESVYQRFLKPVAHDYLKEYSSNKKKVGISWLSMSDEWGAGRSVHLDQILPQLDPAECILVNLQYLLLEEDIKRIRQAGFELLNPVDCYNDLEGLFYLISQCDQVITIDNSVVHFAGAIGVETKLLLPWLPNWRWGLNSSKCDWYPTVEIFRQDESGVWTSAIERACSSLL
jgi:tetratricopeptide (TPR) repeat protein